jgi:hypothetical protein
VAAGEEQYERRVRPATSALESFADDLIKELDLQDGALPWWQGYSDWKTLTMIADYLIQSVQGAGAALISASFAAKTHRESNFADNTALTEAWRAVAESGQTDPNAFFAAMPRDAAARRRQRSINNSAEHCIFHLGQTLDRLSAALVIVGGFEVRDVAGADWGTIAGTPTRDGLVQDLAAPAPRSRVEPPGSPGQILQVELLDPVTRPHDFGPPGWLDWMRDTRNAMTHRSPATQIVAFKGNVNAGFQLLRLFYRQGRWSEVQSLVFGRPPHDQTFWGAFITRPGEDILEGLCESVSKFVVALTDAMTTCWAARTANPTLIVQHGSQWRSVQPTEPVSLFDGYGTDDVTSFLQQADTMAGRDATRWQAARVLDDRRAEWFK